MSRFHAQYEDCGFWMVLSASDALVATTPGESNGDEAAAKRIAACLNALEGVPTDVVDLLPSTDKYWGSVQGYTKLIEQREGLLKALEETHAALCLMDINAGPGKQYMGSVRCKENRAAIAAAKVAAQPTQTN
jgi:hypothetical protein